MSLSPGATLGPYTIRAELGHGGMGVVYTAQDPRLKRQVAIKLLTADLRAGQVRRDRRGHALPRLNAARYSHWHRDLHVPGAGARSYRIPL